MDVLSPSLFGVTIFVLLPFLDAVRRSFLDSTGKTFLGLSVYHGIVDNQAFQLAAGNTIRFMAVALPLLLALSFGLSLLLYSFCRDRSFLRRFLCCP